MKRILSIAISMLLISNIFGVALLADTAEETCYQDAAVGLNPPVTNDFDIGLDVPFALGNLVGCAAVHTVQDGRVTEEHLLLIC